MFLMQLVGSEKLRAGRKIANYYILYALSWADCERSSELDPTQLRHTWIFLELVGSKKRGVGRNVAKTTSHAPGRDSFAESWG